MIDENNIWIEIDTNSILNHDCSKIKISFLIAEYFNLKDGDKIRAYMDNEVWDAVARKIETDDIENQWYAEFLCKECQILNYNEEKAMKIGYINGKNQGVFLAEIDIATKMFKNGVSIETIRKVVRLSDERLKIMENRYSL